MQKKIHFLSTKKRLKIQIYLTTLEKKRLKEVSRLSKLNPSSPEYSVILTYLDWILELPWNESSADTAELSKVREILDSEALWTKKM